MPASLAHLPDPRLRATRIGECLIFDGAKDSSGYGSVQGYGAHRVVWEIEHGEIPPGLEVCHHCDTRPCVEETHLFLAPHAANVADMVAKGRSPVNLGSRNPNARLDEDDVRAIRADPRHPTEIGAAYGVTRQAVELIQARMRWAHVE